MIDSFAKQIEAKVNRFGELHLDGGQTELLLKYLRLMESTNTEITGHLNNLLDALSNFDSSLVHYKIASLLGDAEAAAEKTLKGMKQ